MVNTSPKPIAYTVEHPQMMEPLAIRHSANAWWMNRGKVEFIIASLALGLPGKEACIFAGISLDQYKYFVDCHPQFSQIRKRFELHTTAVPREKRVLFVDLNQLNRQNLNKRY